MRKRQFHRGITGFTRATAGSHEMTRRAWRRSATIRRDTATPNAMADLLVRFWKGDVGLSKNSHELLLDFMRATSTGPNRIRAGNPAGATVAHKTGTWTLGKRNAAVSAAGPGASRSGPAAGRRLASRRDAGVPLGSTH